MEKSESRRQPAAPIEQPLKKEGNDSDGTTPRALATGIGLGLLVCGAAATLGPVAGTGFVIGLVAGAGGMALLSGDHNK